MSIEKQASPRSGGLSSPRTGGLGGRQDTIGPSKDEDEEKKKAERLAVLLEMGVVSKQEYNEKLSVIASPRSGALSPKSGYASPRSGAMSPANGDSPRRKDGLASPGGRRNKETKQQKKLETKFAKLDELLSMGIIDEEEYENRKKQISSSVSGIQV